MSCRSHLSSGLRRVSEAARLLRLLVRIPLGTRMFVSCECCVSSDRGLCDELIARPEESYRLWCVVVSDRETSRTLRPWPTLGRSATGKKIELSFGLTVRSFVTVLTELSQFFPLNRRLGVTHSRCGRFGEHKILLISPGIEWSFSRTVRSFVTVLTELSQFFPLNRRQGVTHRRCGRFGEHKIPLISPGIEWSFSRTVRSFVTVLTELSQSSHWIKSTRITRQSYKVQTLLCVSIKWFTPFRSVILSAFSRTSSTVYLNTAALYHWVLDLPHRW
jgi:hypothetical protein